MSETASAGRASTPEVRRAIVKGTARSAAGIVVYGVILFLPAGRLDWGWGWALLGVLAVAMAAPPLLLVPRNPSVLVEREKGIWHAGVKAWDKRVTALAGGLLFLPWVVAGLDVRFGWTGPVPAAHHLGGLLAVALGHALFLWAMAANAFFSQGVRIQRERGHVVATGGPYRWVRHPGYAGVILSQLGTPFLLGSPWALVPGGLAAALFALRTRLEDRMLLEELPGYDVYARRTPFRLVPGLW